MVKTMFQLFGYALQNNATTESVQLDHIDWEQIYQLSNKHDLAHLVGYALKTSGIKIDEDLQKRFERAMDRAIFRYVKLNYELEAMMRVLTQAEIRFIPLKGSVIRKYYKEPWLRTSSDVDILVDSSNFERAKQLLIEELNYNCEVTCNYYDVSFYTPAQVHIELHHTLVDSDDVAEKVTSTVWERSAPSDSNPFCYEMSDEMFYFYHITHMAKHFVNGGCGIRPFLDLWALNHCCTFEKQKRHELLDEVEFLPFAKAVEHLSDVWFEGLPHTPLTEQLERYILSGGVYGTLGNRIAVRQIISGGKISYLLSRIFLPYRALKEYYPVLKKRKWLYPFYQVKRWFRVFRKGKLKRSVIEAKEASAVSEKLNKSTMQLLADLGLR